MYATSKVKLINLINNFLLQFNEFNLIVIAMNVLGGIRCIYLVNSVCIV